MLLFLHDLPRQTAKILLPAGRDIELENNDVFWLDKVGVRKCEEDYNDNLVYKDGYDEFLKGILNSEELNIVSEMVYGGFSPFIKF